MSLVLSLSAVTTVIAGRRYVLPAQSLTLADNSLTLVRATPTGYDQTTTIAPPTPGTAAIVVLVQTASGSITNYWDVRQIAGADGSNLAPPSFQNVTLTAYNVSSVAEGVGTIRVDVDVTLSPALDSTFAYCGFTYAIAGSGKWHPLIPADTAPNNNVNPRTSLHGLDPDQAYDIAFQAVGVDGKAIPSTPLLISLASPTIGAQSVVTPISKIILPEGSDPARAAIGLILQDKIIARTHFLGYDDIGNLDPVFDDTTNTLFHDVMSQGVLIALTANGDLQGSSILQLNVPGSTQYTTDMMLGCVIGGTTPFPASFYIFGSGGSGSAPKIYFPSAPASPTTLVSYGTSGSPIALPAPLTSTSGTDTIYMLVSYKIGSTAGVVNTYAANALQNSVATGNGYTIYAQKNANFSAALYAQINQDGFSVLFTTLGGTVTFTGGSGGGGIKPGGGKAQFN